jgi:hypothetical protein
MRVQDLPPLLELFRSEKSQSRQKDVPTVSDLLQIGRTSVFKLKKEGKFKVVRFSKRKVLAITKSVLALTRK